MMRYILIFFALLGIGYAQQADLPAGAKPYSGNLFRAVDGTIWTGKPGHYTNIGSKRYVDSLVNLGYKKHQVDSIALDTYNRARNRDNHIGMQPISTITDLTAMLDAKENLVQRRTNLSSPNDVTYPTTKAVADAIAAIPAPNYPVTSVNGKTGAVVINKADVGLSNADNTSDLAKPVSTAVQTALDGKVDKSTTISGSGGISVGGSLATGAVSVGVNDTYFNNKYLRKDVDDNNGTKTLTVGKLVSPSVEADALTLSSLGTGTNTDQLLVVDGTGTVKKKSPVSDVNIAVANSAGTNQFSLGATDAIRFAGSGDASVSFNPATKTVTVTSVPGSGTGGAVSSFNGRTGAVVSASGDYSTDQVTEGSNQYFTDARTRAAVLTGFDPASTSPVNATDNVIQALSKLQGQMNTKAPSGRNLTVSGAAGRTIASGGTQNLTADREWTVDLAPSGVSAGTYTKVGVDNYGRVTSGAMATIADIPTLQGALAAKADVGGGNATGTWPINVTGNAPQWGGYVNGFNDNISSSNMDAIVGQYNNGVFYRFSPASVRQFLDIPSTGEDLQSITDRAFVTTNPLRASSFQLRYPNGNTFSGINIDGLSTQYWNEITAGGNSLMHHFTGFGGSSLFKIYNNGVVEAAGGGSEQWNVAYNRGDFRDFGLGVSFSSTVSDASSINNTSFRMFNDGTGAPTQYGTLATYIRSGSEQTQIYQNVFDGRIYYRGKTNNSFSSWAKVWSSSDFGEANITNWELAFTDRVTTNTYQKITARKVFEGYTGAAWNEGPMEIKGNGSSITPNISFHQPGIYARMFQLKNDGKFYADNDMFWTTGDFNLDVQAANNTVPIRSSTGQIKAADALADEDLVTKRQVPALAAQGSGLVRTVYNNNDQFDFSASHSDNVFRSSVTGSTIQYTVPAGTFTINGSGSIRVKLLGGGGTSSGTNAPRRVIMRFTQSGRVWNVPVVLTNSASSITDFLFSADVNVLVTNPYTNGGARPYYAGMKVKSNVIGTGTGINGTQINSGYVHRNSSLSSNYIDYTQSFSIEFVSDNTGSGSQWTFILETVTIDISSNN